MSRTIYLIAGPSGSGKTALTQALVQRVPRLTKAVTVTTRQPRPGEVFGVDYHFVTPEQFALVKESGALLECDHAYNESYGVPRAALQPEGDLAIIITVAGALALKRLLPNAVSFFVLPPDIETVAERLDKRDAPNRQPRIDSYMAEVAAARYFDHVFLNLDFEQTLGRMVEHVLARRRLSDRLAAYSPMRASLKAWG